MHMTAAAGAGGRWMATLCGPGCGACAARPGVRRPLCSGALPQMWAPRQQSLPTGSAAAEAHTAARIVNGTARKAAQG